MKKTEKVAQENLIGLRKHPQASDTQEGFAKWWMTNQKLSESLALVKQVLKELESEGEVSERSLSDGRTLYSARRVN
jgi:chaperonin cofactor prefoldin